MKKAILFTVAPLLIVSIAWAAGAINSQSGQNLCVTSADVVRHQNASRQGISLTCTSDMVRQLPARGS